MVTIRYFLAGMVGPTPKREQADIYDSWCAVMNGHDGDGEDDCHDMVTEMMVTVTMLKVIAVVTMGLDADICVYG